MRSHKLASILAACCLWFCLAVGTPSHCLAQCANGVCKLPVAAAKAVVKTADPFVDLNKKIVSYARKQTITRKPFRRWRR